MSTRNPRITLEDISRRKMEVLDNIRIQHKVLSEVSQHIFSPFLPPSQGKSSLISKFNTGVAIFEGVILGIKFIYRIRKAFFKR